MEFNIRDNKQGGICSLNNLDLARIAKAYKPEHTTWDLRDRNTDLRHLESGVQNILYGDCFAEHTADFFERYEEDLFDDCDVDR